MGGVAELKTKKPKWNAELDAWVMDFKGRVKIASKKNFQQAAALSNCARSPVTVKSRA